MANLNVRINNKFDTYENWMKSTLVLGAGEIAVASIPSGDDTGLTPPAIGVKIGDGSKTFSQLSWIQATAGDVYGWAKAATKPVYTADEIDGLSAYISGEIQDTDTQYQLVKVDDYNYKLQSKTLDGAWTDVEGSAFVIPKYDDTEVRGLITAIKDGETIDSFADVEAALAGKQATGDYALNSAVTDVADRVAAIEGDYVTATQFGAVNTTFNNTLNGITRSINDMGTQINENGNLISVITNDYLKAADKTELEGKITAAQGAAEAAQADVDALEAKVGTVAEGTTVVDMIGDVAGDVSALDGTVTTLIGEDTGKSARTIANEELAKQLIPENAAEALNELQEIAAWIQAHPDDASAMNAAILALQNQVKGIDAGEGTVKKYIDDAIAALNVGQYALAADLTALAGRVSTLEGEMAQAQTDIEANAKAVSDLDGSLAAIAKTGNVNDLVQTEGDVLVFDCGNSGYVPAE